MSSVRTEEYLETIYDICKEKRKAKVTEIKKALGLQSLASVTEMVQNMAKEGLLNYEKYKGVTLTQKGIDIAKKLDHKHEKIEEFLLLLGIDSKSAQEDACALEHVMTENTVKAIVYFAEFVKSEKRYTLLLEEFRKQHKQLKNSKEAFEL